MKRQHCDDYIRQEETKVMSVVLKKVHKLTIGEGSFALIDDDLAFNKVKDMKWKWWEGKGVFSYSGKRVILLHNMIAPWATVSFVNGDKRDCRKANLTPHRPRPCSPFAKRIYHVPKKQAIEFRYSKRINGRICTLTKCFSYKNQIKEAAIAQAEAAKKQFLSMSKEQIMDALTNRKPRGKLMYARKKWRSHEARRSVMIDGKTYTASVSVTYADQPEEDAIKTVSKIRDGFAAMSKKQFAAFVTNRPRWKPSVSEAVQGWSSYENREAKYREIQDMNISVFFDEK